MKKEDEVRPKEKVGRPKVDPKKIKVIEPKKKSEKEEPKKESFQGIKVNSHDLQKDIKVKNTEEVLDFINGNFKVVKPPNKSQKEKIDSVFKLAEENPKYVLRIFIGETLGDQYVDTEGFIYVQPSYMNKGQNKVPADKKTFKFIRLKGELKYRKDRKYK